MIPIEEYAREVETMQRLQREYFARKNPGVLEQSKRQEKLVARLTRDILNPSLFEGD